MNAARVELGGGILDILALVINPSILRSDRSTKTKMKAKVFEMKPPVRLSSVGAP